MVISRAGVPPEWECGAVLSGNREATAEISVKDVEVILAAALTGMTVDEFKAEAKKWLAAPSARGRFP
jgi:hypothetical protein